jgi:hypothetical protein
MKKINFYILTVATCIWMSAASAAPAYTVNDPTTGYFKQKVESWFDMGEALDPLTFTDFLTCLTKAAGAGQRDLVQLTYKATADAAQCETGSAGDTVDAITMMVKSSKADNNLGTPQIVDIWYNGGPAEPGQVADHFVVEFKQTMGAVESEARTVTDIPFGAFTMNWQHASVTSVKGSLSYVPNLEEQRTYYKLYDASIDGGLPIYSWINGSVKNDLSEGEAHIGIMENNVVSNYRIKYATVASNFVVYIQKTGAAAECYDETSNVEYVYEYNLFDETSAGALKNLSGPFEGVYEWPVGSGLYPKRFHAGPWGIWYEDLATVDRYLPQKIKAEDGTVYSGIIYENDDNGLDHLGVACAGCVTNDGLRVHIVGKTFDQPLVFLQVAQSPQVQSIMPVGTQLEYFGAGNLNGSGLPWQCNTDGAGNWQAHNGPNCDNATDWRPSAAITDFTSLVDTNNDSWVSKAVVKEQNMTKLGTIQICTDNNLTDLDTVASTYPTLTAGNNITAVTNTWAMSETAELLAAPIRVKMGSPDCVKIIGGVSTSCAGQNGQLIAP